MGKLRRCGAAENEDHEGKKKQESLWPIMQIVHTRSRYIYDLFYEREGISKELYEWLLKQGYADAGCAKTCTQEIAQADNDCEADCKVEEARL